MKKIRSNRGFTLAPVMVILLVVLTFTGVTIANAVLHLRTQETAVKQMSGKYTAAGEIEKIYVTLKGLTFRDETSSADLCIDNFEQAIKSELGPVVVELEIEDEYFTVSVERKAGGATAAATFKVDYMDTVDGSDSITGTGSYSHRVTVTSVRYTEFNISSETGAGE